MKKTIKRRFKKKSNMAKTALKTALNVKRRLNQAIERKYLIKSDSALTIVPTAALVDMVLVPQGVDESERIGQKLYFKFLEFKYTLEIPLAATPSAADNCINFVRVALVHDKSPNNATTTLLDIYDSVSILTQRRYASKQRYNILYDKTHSFSLYKNNPVFVKKNKKINILQKYSGTTAAITSLEVGNILLIYWSNLSNGILMNYRLKSWYVDG